MVKAQDLVWIEFPKTQMANKEENEEDFKHYTPQHPLPQEIQNLTRDKTVCKYCGVSYLIHNEIKALEKKLKETEKELLNYKGLEKREALLQQEISLFKHQLEDATSSLETNNKLLSLTTKEKEELKLQNKILDEKHLTYRNTLLNHSRQFSLLHQSVKHYKEDLMHLKNQFSILQSDILHQFSFAFKNISPLSGKFSKEIEEWESKVQCIEMEKMVLAQSNKTLSEALRNKESELQKHNDELNSKRVELENQIEAYRKLDINLKHLSNELLSSKELEVKLSAASNELEECKGQFRILTVENDQYKIHLKSKTSELNELTSKQKQIEQAHELAVQKLHTEIKAKENDLAAYLKQIKSLETQCQEMRKNEQEINQWTRMSANEIQDLKEALSKSKSDVDALKLEREKMIEAHQNRIEDLRESFKNKMAEADNWPQKMQGALSAERSRHLTELKTLEENLKHQFVLELQIEKDKYDELLKKFQDQEKEKQNLKENHRALNEQKYRDEIEELHRKVTDLKRRSNEREEELTKEISSLKKIINELQDRSAKLDGSDSVKIKELQNQLAHVHQDHIDSLSKITLLENKLKETSEEAQFLQSVVKKECEERFELTEALSEARKELLQLKKPIGGYSSVQKRGSVSSINSSNSSLVNIPVTLTPIDDPSGVRSKTHVNSNNLQLSYTADMKTLSCDKDNDAKLQENRKRILSMMGRR
ncbi:Leucine-, glutamate- and lysine-rich protein 1 [Bulinus truncatus]|nr:Leucine-, glutamate- and lysine-rich protein 1 [Bulinus truncatus]